MALTGSHLLTSFYTRIYTGAARNLAASDITQHDWNPTLTRSLALLGRTELQLGDVEAAGRQIAAEVTSASRFAWICPRAARSAKRCWPRPAPCRRAAMLARVASAHHQERDQGILMVRLAGFEPTTPWFVGILLPPSH